MRKWGLWLLILPFLLMTGCTTTPTTNTHFGIYYINAMQTGLVKEDYTIRANVFSGKVQELIERLSEDVDEVGYTCALPEGVELVDYDLVDRAMVMHFSREYTDVGATREVLMRAAVAKTFLQMDEVTSVTFYIGDSPLTDVDGNVVGAMTDETFLDTFGEQEEALDSSTFVLYYASEDGQKLVRKKRLIHFNNTMSAESVVLSYLAKNPNTDDGAKAVLSPSTKIISATTKDGVCYVNLDSSFLSQSENISTTTAVYGIVNSLAELPNVSKVEITVETSDSVMIESDSASGLYTPDLSLVISDDQ